MVPQDICNVQGPETPRYTSRIAWNQKPQVSRIFFVTPDISTNRTKPSSQATSTSDQPKGNPTSSIASGNCKDIRFYPNDNWNKIVCTYQLLTGEMVWKTQTGEREPSWCTSLIFAHANGQCFIPPVVVHQSNHYTQGIHLQHTHLFGIHN